MKKISITLFLSLAVTGFAQSATSEASRPSAPDGEIGGHAYVDLGLPSGNLWATRNIGAESLYHPGQYFAWGETQPRDFFDWRTYEFLKEEFTDSDGLQNYSVIEIGENISGTEYDAARVQWADAWKTPSKEDWDELLEHCKAEYVEYSQISSQSGLRICGANGSSILLPLTFSPHGGVDIALLRGEYWSASVGDNPTSDRYPSALMFSFLPGSSTFTLTQDCRHEGLAIRPVINRKDIGTSVCQIADRTQAMTHDGGILSIGGEANGCKITVSDISGRSIFSTIVPEHGCRLSIPTTKGIYLAILSEGDRAISTLKIGVK